MSSLNRSQNSFQILLAFVLAAPPVAGYSAVNAGSTDMIGTTGPCVGQLF